MDRGERGMNPVAMTKSNIHKDTKIKKHIQQNVYFHKSKQWTGVTEE